MFADLHNGSMTARLLLNSTSSLPVLPLASCLLKQYNNGE
jgi:hypothetical protein